MAPPDPKAPSGRWRRAGRTFTREFLIPVGLALVFIQFAVQAFKIPSASMENTLRIGDFLLGLKFLYGSPVPFTHKRLPAMTDPKPGDVLIFRYPGDPYFPEGNPERYRFVANLFLFGNLYWDRAPGPGEKKLVWYAPKDFIKRCVARSGQTLEVAGTRVRVDGRELPLPPEGLYAAGSGGGRRFDPVRDSLVYRLPVPGETLDLDTLSLREATWIRSLAIQENPDRKVELRLELWRGSVPVPDHVFPYLNADYLDRNQQAALYFLGLPLSQHSAGGREYLQARNVPFRRIQELARTGYVRMADLMPELRNPRGRREEFNEYYLGVYLDLVARNLAEQDPGLDIRKSLVIDGVATTTYTVREPVYFMMGDNRDNSSDSRYWGPLSRNNVRAKALILYYSFENDNRSFSFANPLSWVTVPFKIRWNRLGLLIE